MSRIKDELTYIKQVYVPVFEKKPIYTEQEQGNNDRNRNSADNQDREAHKLAWEAMWREVDAFWVRSGAALVILGGATSLLFQSDLTHLESAFLGYGLLLMVIVWRQINIGSLFWMSSWMTHVDTLEDEITGPLYKTVFHEHTHSTTKSIAHLSLVGVWAATVNAAYQVYRAVHECLDIAEQNCPGMIGTEGRIALYGWVFIICALFIWMFIRMNISFTKDETDKKRYLRRVMVGPVSKPWEAPKVMQVEEKV